MIFDPFQGSGSGNALGIRISSLEKLMNTKSTSSKRTLLHYLVETSEQKDPDALAFVDTLLEPLQKTSRYKEIRAHDHKLRTFLSLKFKQV